MNPLLLLNNLRMDLFRAAATREDGTIDYANADPLHCLITGEPFKPNLTAKPGDPPINLPGLIGPELRVSAGEDALAAMVRGAEPEPAPAAPDYSNQLSSLAARVSKLETQVNAAAAPSGPLTGPAAPLTETAAPTVSGSGE